MRFQTVGVYVVDTENKIGRDYGTIKIGDDYVNLVCNAMEEDTAEQIAKSLNDSVEPCANCGLIVGEEI